MAWPPHVCVLLHSFHTHTHTHKHTNQLQSWLQDTKMISKHHTLLFFWLVWNTLPYLQTRKSVCTQNICSVSPWWSGNKNTTLDQNRMQTPFLVCIQDTKSNWFYTILKSVAFVDKSNTYIYVYLYVCIVSMFTHIYCIYIYIYILYCIYNRCLHWLRSVWSTIDRSFNIPCGHLSFF